MTQTEISLCQSSIAEYMQNAEKANFVQDLNIRLKSAASMMETAIQECISIFDEMEQITNNKVMNEGRKPVSIQFSSKVEDGHLFAVSMSDILSSALMNGAESLRQDGVIWFAEEEPVQAVIDGKTVECWHMINDGETAEVCIDYLGGPRIEVPLSALSRRAE